jgi:hypothetical protein
MRAAASFEIGLQTGLRERVLVSLWSAVSLAAFAAWLASHGWATVRPDTMPAWVPALAASVSGVLAAAAAWVCGRGERATLAWSRGSWLLTRPAPDAPATPGSLALMLDLGPWMLLRFRAVDRRASRWFCIDESAAGPAWHALRAAVYRPVRRGTAPKGPAGDPFP